MLGFLNIYKEKGITSHDVINRLRKILNIKQIGHSGTLDPMAEGVMAVGIGKATRLLQYLGDDKTYLAEVQLGRTTDTDDLEGKVLSECDDFSNVNEELVRKRLSEFVGKQEQIPPIYSAIKKGGMKMYDLARRGEAPEVLDARSVEIYSVEMLSYALPFIRFRVACSKGTYIRSIARDLGRMLGTGGCLSGLIREQAGPFRIEESKKLNELEELKKNAATNGSHSVFDPLFVSPWDALEIQHLSMSTTLAKKLAHGQVLGEDALESLGLSPGRYIVAIDDRPIALVSLQEGNQMKPEVVLANVEEI